MVKNGYVYLICDAEKDLYKIGVTRGIVEDRMKELQTGNGGELHVVHVQPTDKPYKMETMLHNRFKLTNKHGEWFELTNEEVLEFAKYCELCQRNIDALRENPFFK